MAQKSPFDVQDMSERVTVESPRERLFLGLDHLDSITPGMDQHARFQVSQGRPHGMSICN